MSEALSNVKLRIHQDIVLNTSSVLDGPAVLILPAQTRYETPGGGTATSTERRIRFTPEIPGPRIDEARPEWRIPVDLAIAARPELADALAWRTPGDIRAEMARAIPSTRASRTSSARASGCSGAASGCSPTGSRACRAAGRASRPSRSPRSSSRTAGST